MILKIHNTIFILFLLFGISVYGQIDTRHINDSPYNVIQSHSYYLKEKTYSPQKAALTIPSSVKNRADVAIKLKKVLDGRGINATMLRAPKKSNYIDSLSQQEVYYLYPLERRIYVEKSNGKWYFSKETVSQLDELYDEIYILDINAKKYFPASYWYKKVIGITLIKWLGLLLVLPLCFIVYIISRYGYYYIVNKAVKKQFSITATVSNQIKKSSRLVGVFLATKLFNILLPQIQLPVAWNAFLLRTVGIISTIILIALINKIVDALFAYYKIKSTNKDHQILPVINRILKVFIWIIGGVYMLQYLGVNVVTLLTGLSIGGLVLALAAQDTVKNLIGSVMIFIDKPFQVGDWIKFNSIEGEVEEIGVRSTRIRTFEDTLVYVPNSILADNVVDNIGLRKHRRYKTNFKFNKHVPIAKLNDFIEKFKALVTEHPKVLNNSVEVRINDISEGLPNLLFYCFLDVNTYAEELKVRHEIISKILALAEQEKIDFALPSNLVYLHDANNTINECV